MWFGLNPLALKVAAVAAVLAWTVGVASGAGGMWLVKENQRLTLIAGYATQDAERARVSEQSTKDAKEKQDASRSIADSVRGSSLGGVRRQPAAERVAADVPEAGAGELGGDLPQGCRDRAATPDSDRAMRELLAGAIANNLAAEAAP